MRGLEKAAPRSRLPRAPVSLLPFCPLSTRAVRLLLLLHAGDVLLCTLPPLSSQKSTRGLICWDAGRFIASPVTLLADPSLGNEQGTCHFPSRPCAHLLALSHVGRSPGPSPRWRHRCPPPSRVRILTTLGLAGPELSPCFANTLGTKRRLLWHYFSSPPCDGPSSPTSCSSESSG